MSAFIYLASQSPRRSQLLTQIGVRHELLLPRSLSDFGIVGCECAAAAHFLPSSCPIVPLWGGESGKNWSRWGPFSLSTPKVRQAPRTAGVEDTLVDVAEDLAEDAEALEAVRSGEAPACYVQRVTALKLDAAVARHARRGLPAAPILCADTTVALGRRIFGKPADAAEAERMLAALSGRVHRVLTAVALQAGPRRLAALSVSRVRFAAMTPAQIAAYVASGEPLGKAGAYGVQGRAAAFIVQLAGSYSGIMGLPLYETAQLLREIGFAQ